MPRWARGFVLVLFVELLAANQAVGGWNQWTTMGPVGPGGPGAALAIDPVTPTTIYTARWNEAAVFKSTDGGAHWRASNIGPAGPPFVSALAVDPRTPATVYAGTNGFDGWGVFKSTDGGMHWSPSSAGLPPVINNRSSFVATLILDPENPATVYAGTSVGLFKSTDAGGFWSAHNTGLPDLTVWALAIDAQNPSTLYAATTAGVFKSMDGADHWFFSDTGLPHLFVGQPLPGVASLTVDPHDPTTVYAGTVSGVYKSTDGGEHWNFSMNGVHFIGDVLAVAVDPQTPGTLYAATEVGGMYKSTDSAETWAPFTAGLSDIFLNGLAVSPSGACLHAASQAGVFSLVTRPDPCAAPVNPAISVNESTFEVGQTLTASVGLLNLGDQEAVDIYLGILIPNSSSSESMPGVSNQTIVFFTGANTFALGTFDDFASYRPVATGVPLVSSFAATVPDFFSYRWTGAEPLGPYAFVFYVVRAGALSDGDLTPDELLASAVTGFSFAPP
jgi:photosystem II stability/assembly factor-like uncharacterized protein